VKTIIKNLFFICRLHIFFRPFKKLYLQLYYLTTQSEWIVKNKSKAGINDFFTSKYEVKKMYTLFDWVNQHYLKDQPVDYVEFGVFKGDSIQWWVQNRINPNDRFFGFDTFTGLPEDFGAIKKGGYSAEEKIPVINDARCRFIKGLFQETLFPFLKTYEGSQKKLIHIDCDLYSSTLFVLTTMGPYLKNGDILIFDEFITPTQEFKAFHDFCAAYYLEFELIGGQNNFHQTAVVLKRRMTDDG
jgi:O-methyltransferase